jgi:hypothetical protein
MQKLKTNANENFFAIIKESPRVAFYTALITALVTGVIITPIGTTLSEVGKQVIEKIFEDSEIKELVSVRKPCYFGKSGKNERCFPLQNCQSLSAILPPLFFEHFSLTE